jgi:hypothetical protein
MVEAWRVDEDDATGWVMRISGWDSLDFGCARMEPITDCAVCVRGDIDELVKAKGEKERRDEERWKSRTVLFPDPVDPITLK